MSKSLIISSKKNDFIESELSVMLERLELSKNSPDYLEISPANQSIGISQTRELKEWLKKKPYNSTNKLAVLVQADRLTIEAQNSILKQLEEPPQNTYIVLLTSNHRNFLPTVLSRCELILDSSISELSDETQFFESKLTERLVIIEDILKEKNSQIQKNNIQIFLNKLLITLEKRLREGHINDKLVYNINLVQLTINMINANTSKRLALENLVLNMEEL